MRDHYDRRETQPSAQREQELFQQLPQVISAALASPGWREHLGAIDPSAITSRAALAALPVLRKSSLPARQEGAPPFGGFSVVPISKLSRLFASPGPIYEAEKAVMATKADMTDHMRLSCQIRVIDDLHIRVINQASIAGIDPGPRPADEDTP